MPAGVSIDISEAMAALDPKGMNDAVDEAIKNAAELMLVDVKKYPSEPSGSAYKRTGALGRSWRILSGDERRKELVSDLWYTQFVQDEDRQSRVHKGRWPTVQYIVRQRVAQITKVVEQRLGRWAS